MAKKKPKKPPKNGVAATVPRERLLAVADLLAKCVPHWQIESEISERYKITTRQVRNYVAAVYRDWSARAEERRPHVRAELDAAFRSFYGKALDVGEYRSAITALDRLARLHGAYEAQRVEVAGSLDGTVSVDVSDPDAVRRRIAELVSQIKPGRKDA